MTGNIALNGNYLSGDGGDEGVFVAANGKVGIGTTAPEQLLHVSGGSARIKIETTLGNQNPVLELAGTTYTNFIFSDQTDGGTYIRTDSADRDIILQAGNGSQGNVGIGTTTPDTKLHVAGAMTQEPLSSDPADPDAGNSVQWVSDGTGTGDAGDVMLKVNVAGTTKVITLIDYSVA